MVLIGFMVLAFLIWQLNRSLSVDSPTDGSAGIGPVSQTAQIATGVVFDGATATGPKETGTKTPLPSSVDEPPLTATPTPSTTPSPTPIATAVLTATPKPTKTPTPTPTDTPGPSDCSLAASGDFHTLWLQQWRSLGCPQNKANSSWGATESFERGRMIWLQYNDMIYVLDNGGKWAAYKDVYEEGAPEPGGYQPPDGLRAPIRGFGIIWREKLGGADARIGWATEQEKGLNILSQTFEKGMIFQVEGQIYILGDNGSRWQAP